MLAFFFCLMIIMGQKKKSSIQIPAEKLTAQQAQMSNNPQLIAAYIKSNPNDPNMRSLRIKLIELVTPAKDPAAKPKVERLTKSKLRNELKNEPKSGNQTAKVLNHLFNDSPNKKEAYVQIVNKSKCNMVVKFTGKNNYYNLNVPANNNNFIMVNKGQYVLTTGICDAKYSSAKNITKDIAITLAN